MRSILSSISLVLCLLAGCSRQQPSAIYENAQLGFSFSPPAGWSERARWESLPLETGQERVLVQYKRLQAGKPAWLRISVAEFLESTSLETYVARRSPGREWHREKEIETLEVGGRPASTVTFGGRCGRKDLLCETIAVRRENRVYFFMGFFLLADSSARDAFRKAVETVDFRQISFEMGNEK
jgi:hypothetical protein